MKSIKKLKKYGTAVVGSALLVGATLSGAAASNHNNDLGDYPAPFVDEEGEVTSSIVVGEDGKTTDVVGAIDIAGGLGQEAFETVSSSEGSVSVDGEDVETGIRGSVADTLVDRSDYSRLLRDTVEDSDGDDHFVTESVGLDSDDGGSVTTEVNDSEVVTKVPEGAVDYQVSYSPGFSVGDQIPLLGTDYELVSISDSEIELGSKKTVSGLGIDETFEHGPYTVKVEGANSEDSEALVQISEDGKELESKQLSSGESVSVEDDITVSAETVFYSSSNDGWVIKLESVLSDLTVEQGEKLPLDENYEVQNINSKDSEVQGLELTNTLKTVEDPSGEDEREHIREGGSFQGPNDYFRVGFEGLTEESTDSIEIEDEYEVTYSDEDNFEHTLDISKLKASTSADLYSSNPYLDNGKDDGEILFYSSDSTWDEGSDAMILDNDNDGLYSSQKDNRITGSSASISDQLSNFSASDNVYSTTTAGYDSGAGDAIFIDQADNGYFDEQGLVVSGTGASTDLSDAFDGQMDVTFDGGSASTITLDNSGSISLDALSTLGLQGDAGTNIAAGEPVKIASTGNYYIADSVNNAGESSTLEVIGAVNTPESDLKGSAVERQVVGGQTDFGVQTDGSTSTDTGGDGVGTIGLASATDLDSTPDVNEGNLVVVDEDYSSEGTSSFTDGDEDFFVVSEDQGASDSAVEVVGQTGITIPDGADVFKVTPGDGGNSADEATVDARYLDSGTDIASAINDEISGDGTATFNLAPYDSGQYSIQSGSTASGSDVSVSSPSSGTDLATSLDLNNPDVDTGRDTVVAGSSLSYDDGYVKLGSGDQIKFFNADDEGGSGFDVDNDDVIDDKGGQGTFTYAFTDKIKAGSGSPANGDSLKEGLDQVKFGVKNDDGFNSDEDLVAVDSNDDGVYGSGDTLISGNVPGGIIDETDSSQTVFTDVSGRPVEIDWDKSGNEVTLSYETFDVSIAPGESVSRSTGYGFTLDADFKDLNGDSNADLSVSNSDATLDTEYGAEISFSGSEVTVDEDGSNSVDVSFDGSDEIDNVGFGGTPSDITSEDEDTYTDYGSLVEVGSDMSSVGLEVPEEMRDAVHTVGGESSTGSGDVSRPSGWPDSARLDSAGAPGNNVILVGGPVVNDLTEELAENGLSRTADNYSEDTGYLELVHEAFGDYSALVVAGHSGEDTQNVADYISNYGSHEEVLSGKEKVAVNTETDELVE